MYHPLRIDGFWRPHLTVLRRIARDEDTVMQEVVITKLEFENRLQDLAIHITRDLRMMKINLLLQKATGTFKNLKSKRIRIRNR